LGYNQNHNANPSKADCYLNRQDNDTIGSWSLQAHNNWILEFMCRHPASEDHFDVDCLDPRLPTKPDRPDRLHTATSLPIPETLDFNHVIKKQRAYDYWQEI
jgi:hypothetical protein